MAGKCARSSLLVAVLAVGMATVLAAPSVDSSSITMTGSSVQQGPNLRAPVDWNSIRDSTICPAQVVFNRRLQVLEVWCADGVEGQTFEARGQQYVCTSLRYTIPIQGVEVDVLGGCVARLDRPDVTPYTVYATDK